MFDIITIGSATRDVFLRSKAIETHTADHSPTGIEACLPLGSKVAVDEIHFTTGGGATNAAVTFARLGRLRTAIVGRIGAADAGGRTVLADLHHERVDTRLIQRDPKLHTAYSLILLAGSGERTILSYRGASEDLTAAEIPWGKLRTRWFYVTSLGGNLTLVWKILVHAKRIGAKVAWNPGGGEIAHGWNKIAPLAARTAVFNLNREEAAALTEKDPKDVDGILRTLHPTPPRPPSRRDWGKRKNDSPSLEEWAGQIVLVTDGEGGAYACADRTALHIASRRLTAVNTTGAGDAFGSAFVLGLMRSDYRLPATGYRRSIGDALRLAMANAEGVITHMGAKAGILSRVPSRATLAKYRIRTLDI